MKRPHRLRRTMIMIHATAAGPHVNQSSAVGDSETRDQVIQLITRAFRDDPTVRWVFREPADYGKHFPNFITAFAGAAFEERTVDIASDMAGAAVWLAPGSVPDETAVGGVLTTFLSEVRQPDVFAMLEEMGSFHPTEPHWYLPLIGVDTHFQGRGVGSDLLRRRLAICDRDRTPAYLESTNPRNVPLYERFGFRTLGTIQVGDSPPVIPMRREPIRVVNH